MDQFFVIVCSPAPASPPLPFLSPRSPCHLAPSLMRSVTPPLTASLTPFLTQPATSSLTPCIHLPLEVANVFHILRSSSPAPPHCSPPPAHPPNSPAEQPTYLSPPLIPLSSHRRSPPSHLPLEVTCVPHLAQQLPRSLHQHRPAALVVACIQKEVPASCGTGHGVHSRCVGTECVLAQSGIFIFEGQATSKSIRRHRGKIHP